MQLLILLWVCFTSCTSQNDNKFKDFNSNQPIIVLDSSQVRTGADQLLDWIDELQDLRVGLIVNQSSLSEGRHLLDRMLEHGVQINCVFALEHGIRGKEDAGAKILDGKDPSTGTPVFSLYGKSKKPSAEQLEKLDVLIFDIQDVGVRFYTYISSLHYIMEAVAESNKEIWVLDRPNPNGYYVDGPVLDPAFKSFVGMHPVPIVHGMTIGEYARMINGEKWLKNAVQAKLKVRPVQGYTHSSTYVLPTKPSPNLPNLRSIILYPSLCLFEGTDFSVGRGTDWPFQVFGSPTYEQGTFDFTPLTKEGASNPKHVNELCHGYSLRDISMDSLLLEKQLNLDYLIQALSQHEERIIRAAFFDKLAGSDLLRKQLIAGASEASIRASWQEALNTYNKMRKAYLIYPE